LGTCGGREPSSIKSTNISNQPQGGGVFINSKGQSKLPNGRGVHKKRGEKKIFRRGRGRVFLLLKLKRALCLREKTERVWERGKVPSLLRLERGSAEGGKPHLRHEKAPGS